MANCVLYCRISPIFFLSMRLEFSTPELPSMGQENASYLQDETRAFAMYVMLELVFFIYAKRPLLSQKNNP
jgi:hypothetical protein